MTQPDFAELRYADGSPVAIPTRMVIEKEKDEYGKIHKRQRRVYSLRGESRCPRCGGQAEKDGTVLAGAGRIVFWMPDDTGRWLSYVGACGGPKGPPYTGCIYGAIVRARGERWVEDYNVPQGLSTFQWTILHEAMEAGDGFAEAAERLRKRNHGPMATAVADLCAKVQTWRSVSR